MSFVILLWLKSACVHRTLLSYSYCHLLTISPYFLFKKKEKVYLKHIAFQIMPPAIPPYFGNLLHIPIPFLEDVSPCLIAFLSIINSCLILGSTNIHRKHWSLISFTTSLPMVLSFVWFQPPALRLTPWASSWPNCITSETIFLSFPLWPPPPVFPA